MPHKNGSPYLAFLLLQILVLYSQAPATAQSRLTQDTIPEVVVTVWGNSRNRLQSSSSISLLKPRDFQKAAGSSLVPVFNQVPGLQMEERSPGSYRISIRGSSIRSPYGVRNIKVYLDNFSLTDAGGNTYLNALDMLTIGSAQVLKGPASSAYGAGTGGVILIKTLLPADSGEHISLLGQAGSFGLKNISLQLSSLSSKAASSLFFSDFKTQGYRVNTALERKVVHFHNESKLGERDLLGITGFYSDLYYQTPGGLTLTEYLKNPRQARPATKTTPSAVSQHAAIYTKQVFLGISNRYNLNEAWYNESALSLNNVQFKNPFISNYERKTEQNYSFRSVLHYLHPLFGYALHAQFGVEYANYFSPDKDYKNHAGVPDSVTRDDEIQNTQFTAFVQAEQELPWSLIATAGLSLNKVHYQVFRLSQLVPGLLDKNFLPVLSPRISILKSISGRLSVYTSLNFGYSPPSNLETLSATGIFNSGLEPEKAISWEVGIKGARLAGGNFDFDFTAFDNHVSQTIVRRTNEKGQEYFINEGNTLERGLELSSWIYFLRDRNGFVKNFSFKGSGALNHFEFGAQGLGSVVSSGKALTGTPPYTADAGLDISTIHQISLSLNMHYSDKIPLNDVSTEKSKAFTVFSSRLDFSPIIGKIKINAFVGADNLFNKHYSLGNDLNAFGQRYYNAAPARNYFIGLKLGY